MAAPLRCENLSWHEAGPPGTGRDQVMEKVGHLKLASPANQLAGVKVVPAAATPILPGQARTGQARTGQDRPGQASQQQRNTVEVTNKKETKDVVYTDCKDTLQEAALLPPMEVDRDKQGRGSDHSRVQLLPNNNLAPEDRSHREQVKVQPFPESKIMDSGFKLINGD